MIRINTLIIILVALMAATVAQAQTVVILNGVPTKVVLDGKRIVSVQGPVNGHMAGYDNSKASTIAYGNTPATEIIDAIPAADYASTTTTNPTPTKGTTASTSTVTNTKVVTTDTKPTEPKVSAPVVSAPVKNTATPPTTPAATKPAITGNYFKFSGNSALLSELAINEIKDYANKINVGEASQISLESFYTNGNKRSEELVQNRLDAIKKYFEISGVPASAIQVNKIADNAQSDKVSITLQ